jgi:hypothetical protein
MKKILVLAVGLLMVAMAATAFAQPKLDMKISGFVDWTGNWYMNVPSGGNNPAYGLSSTDFNANVGNAFANRTSAINHEAAWANSRARLRFDASMGKDLSGTIFLEMDSDRWGNPDGTRNKMGYWGADRAAVEIKNAYFDVGVPYFGIPVPITVRFGLQPFAIRDTWFLYTDGAGIIASFKPDPVTINALWGKAREGKDASSDDGDLYGINAYAKVDTFTFGGYGTYFNLKSYPLNNSTLVYGANPSNRAYAWYFGGYFDGSFGPLKINTDFIYDTGKIKAGWDNAANLATLGASTDIKMSGWLAQGSFTWPWEMFEFGGGAMYASGADANKTSGAMLPGTTTASGAYSSKMSGFVVAPGSEPGPDAMGFGSVIYGHPYLSREPCFGNQTADYNNFTSGAMVGGSWNARLWGAYKVAPWYKVTLQAMYIGDTVSNGNWFGNARKYPGTASTLLKDSDSIGFEATLTNMFQIYPNLTAGLVGGYLWAGSALAEFYVPGLGANKEIDNPWMVGTRMVYSF